MIIYQILQKAIVILITDFKIENLEELDYHSRWKIMEDKQGKKIILTQKLEIDIIGLMKIKKRIKKHIIGIMSINIVTKMLLILHY